MIEIKNISKKYGNNIAVDKLNLKIEKGDFIGLLGPNGAGKTTLIKMIVGLLNADSGEILIENERLFRNNLNIKSKLGVVPQHINLDKELSIYEHMYFTGKLYKMDKKTIVDRTEEILEFLELNKHRKKLCKNLSGGMQRKLMIGRAILHNPDYIILDEPTVGIDLNTRIEIWDMLKKMKNDGKTMLLTTHYIEEAESLCERVALMDLGKIFYDDSPKKLIEKLGKKTVEYFKEGKTFYDYKDSLNEAKQFSNSLGENYMVRDTTLEDVFYSFANKRVE